MNRQTRNGPLFWTLPVLLVSFSFANKADQLELANGDRYVGEVIAVTKTNVMLRSEVNGLMQLPRSKVTVITFGDKLASPAKAPPPTPVTQKLKAGPNDLAA